MSARPGASATVRGLGLLVDGPVLWGRPVPSRASGVFVIEMAAPQAEAPIDVATVGRWLERVPSLRVAGDRPTAHALAAHLAQFWLPEEPIVYVGRSAKSIGARLAALFATPLGDSRPNSGGHWLRTLRVLPQLRIWWAECDAHEEYEDALLSAVAERQAEAVRAGLPGAPLVLPFANLQAPNGEIKPHGLTNSLRDPGEPTGAAARDAAARAPRSALASRPARPATARSARQPREPKPSPPPAAPTLLSEAGVASLKAELAQLKTEVRPIVIERVKTARELGDLRENSEYESARREQSFVEGRIQALEALIRSAVIVEADPATGVAGVGSTVVVEVDGRQETWVLVGSSEADPAAGRVSYAAPIGKALLGRRAGDEAVARLPAGEIRLRLLEVR